jgi:sphingomyelin phosphodiesterase acid-like 3
MFLKQLMMLVAFISSSAVSTSGKFWWFTDFHVDIWGSQSIPHDKRCAWTPSSQMLSAIESMTAINPDPDFILLSGDIVHYPGRNSSDLGRDVILETISEVTAWLIEKFPAVPIYPALGNHDNHPSNNWPVNPERSAWLYGALANMWAPWLPSSALETVKAGGFYSSDIKDIPNLRVITLNTNYLTVYNTALSWNTTIAESQLEWVQHELQQAQEDGVKVIMNGHHPFIGVHIQNGVEVGSLWPQYQQRYSVLSQTYKDIIIGHFVGHDHVDEVRVINACSFGIGGNLDLDSSSVQTCGGEPVGVVYVGQALTNCQVPAFREWAFDTATLELTDYSQYWYKLDNITGKETWPLQYQWSSAYPDMDDMSPSSWRDEIVRMSKNATSFDNFIARRGLIKCGFNTTCSKFTLCNYLHGGEQATGEFLNCIYRN